jgi:two-component system, NarL family, response regulator NreC
MSTAHLNDAQQLKETQIPPNGDETVTTIVIADDHRVVRVGLRLLLEAEEGLFVVGEAQDVASAEQRISSCRPDVLVLDVSMPGGPSVESIARLRQLAPDTQIVVLTQEDDPVVARIALRSGAAAFIPKAAASTELIGAVRLAASGLSYLSPQLGAKIAAADDTPGGPDGLTDRHIEVLRLLAGGHTNEEIGRLMYLSVRTIESHRAAIQQKTGRKGRAQLVAYARQHKLT